MVYVYIILGYSTDISIFFQTKFGANLIQKPRETRRKDYDIYRSRISIAEKSQRQHPFV